MTTTKHFTLSDLRFLMLLQDGRTLYKVSNVYDNYFTAIVELDQTGNPPERTTVREIGPETLSRMTRPSRAMMNRYDEAYGRG